ncbi:phage tail protein [Lentzea sp. E54]|uniref:phage tail protein n=1 Tax=Lentzea xerophila TaxID=3435883 RepID=UPI003DA49C8E
MTKQYAGTEKARAAVLNQFNVVIDAASRQYDLGMWAKVDGLSVQWDLAEYRAGDAGNHRWYLPGRTRYSNVKLERAACAESDVVKHWLTATSFDTAGFSGSVALLDPHSGSSEPLVTWELNHIIPCRWSIVGFQASGSGVALETLELVHEGFLGDQRKS